MATGEDGKGLEGAAQAGVEAAKDMADKVKTAAGDAVEAAKDALDAAGDAVEDMAGDALAAARDALGDAGAAVTGAAAAAGGAAKASVTKFTNLAGEAVSGAGQAAAGAADAVKDIAGDALAAAKGAVGGAGAAVAGVAGATAAAATVVSTRATGSGGFGAGLRARDEADRSGGGGAAPPVGALDKQPDNLLFWGSIIVGGIAALGVAGWLFVQVGKTPATAPAPANTENTTVIAATPAPAAATDSGMPVWLASINGSLKEVFSWLGVDMRSGKVLVSGEAPDQASKDAALQQATELIRANPDGAAVAIIDGITVPGGAAPVGAAFAALGANPDAAACQAAFVDTMAGRTINFTVGSAEISADSAAILDALSGVASACQAHAIEIGGHTDKTGDAAANTALSQARADAVKAYWEGRTVPVTSVTTKGYGPDKPVDPADTPEAYAANRRIEFIVTAAP